MSLPVRILFAAMILLVLVLGLGLQTVRGDSTPITGTACISSGCNSIFASGPEFSLSSFGSDAGPPFNCVAGTPCDFSLSVGTVTGFTAIGSFEGQAADLVRGALNFAAPPTDLPFLTSPVAVEEILPVVVTGQFTGFEGGKEVWAVNIGGTGTLDAPGRYLGNGQYFFPSATYQFSGLTYTPEPSTWIYAFSALLVTLIAKRKKLVSLFFNTAG
jgi:hypothetical protein